MADNETRRGRRPITPAGAFWPPYPDTRRGLCLYLFSLAVIALGGLNYVVTNPRDLTLFGFVLEVSHGSISAWGWLMVLVGVACLFSSFCHFGRDRWGFRLLAGFCAGWAMGFVCAFLFFDAPVRALGSAVVWALFACLLPVIAGFPSFRFGADLACPTDRNEGR